MSAQLPELDHLDAKRWTQARVAESLHKPRLLDLFCGAGGASMGYSRAGFDVTGVDIAPQKHYPFEFHQADALAYATEHGHEYDVIHASPPCQSYSVTKQWAHSKPKLIADVRCVLRATGKPFVIENVSGAIRDMQSVLMLCGLGFGLKVFRHRYFESSHLLFSMPHPSHKGYRVGLNMCCVCGTGDSNWRLGQHVAAPFRTRNAFSAAMGIDWMTKAEMCQAIPPDYTTFIGRQLLRVMTE